MEEQHQIEFNEPIYDRVYEEIMAVWYMLFVMEYQR